MLLQDARRAARATPAGDIILLEDQDRGLWDRAQIAEGRHRSSTPPSAAGDPGPYRVQAAIAACHATPPPGPGQHRLADDRPGCTASSPA